MATTDALGNLNVAPGFAVGTPTSDKELLASSVGYSQDGAILRVGQGTLAVGTPLVRHDDNTVGALGSADRVVANTVTFTDAGDLVTTPVAHGLVVGEEVKVASVATTTGIVANTTYFVKTVPSSTTLTLSATNGGSTLALTTDGTGGALSQVETDVDVIGFLRRETYTGVTGDIPKHANVVWKGTLKYSLIKAANGATDLSAATLAALGARVDLKRDFLNF